MSLTLSVTENVVPGARAGAAGSVATTVATRSGRATVTIAAGEPLQLLPSSVSATAARSSAHASRKYVLSGVVAGIVTIAVPEWLASGASAGTARAPVNKMSPGPLTAWSAR